MKKILTDKRISEITGITTATLCGWKKGTSYRPKLYMFLKLTDESVLLEFFGEKTQKEKVENTLKRAK